MGEMTGSASSLPFFFAFQAGLLTAVSPCAFAMLPAYLSYHLGAREEGFSGLSPFSRLARAVLLAAIASLGFGLLFGGVGFVAVLGGRALLQAVTGATTGVALGALLVLLGAFLLATGKPLSIPLGFVRAPVGRGVVPSLLFGAAYGLAALSCMAPLFLLVIVNALNEAGVAGAASQFGFYTTGMATVLGAVTIGAALFKGIVAIWLQRLLPYVEWASAALLVLAGGYIIAYWTGAEKPTLVSYVRGLGLAFGMGIGAVTLVRWLLLRQARSSLPSGL
ncbi:MAG: cytochrome c biogenesis protein CcdA [Chloroflexi bacterium]|nr:cytochrome c biogenesis protein CcdA [Chloroflexota bacterium]